MAHTIADFNVSKTVDRNKPEADLLAIRNVGEKFLTAYNAADLEGFCALLTEDAVLMPPNEPPVTGIEAVRCRIEAFFMGFTFCMKFQTVETNFFGDRAFERGSYTAYALLKGQAGQQRGGYGEYLLLFERQPDKLMEDRFLRNRSST